MSTQTALPNQQPRSCDPLFFRILCDPGHERTARELSQLNRQDRAKVWADMAGEDAANDGHVADPPNVPMIMAGFRHLLQKLTEQVTPETQPYLQAASLDVHDEYVHDPEWIQMFLRSEEWHVARAVARYLRHYVVKKSLLNHTPEEDPQSLCIPWRYSDLTDEDREVQATGTHQVLPLKDTAGRMIFVGQLKYLKYKSIKSVLRQISYLLTSSVRRDIGAQRHGVLIIGYEVGSEYVEIERDYYRKLFECMRSLPIRVVSAHVCLSPDNSPMKHMLELFVHITSPFVRLRLRYHYGSHQECRYRLMTMGIPVNMLPVTADERGTMLLDNHKRWIQYCIHQEAQIVEDIHPEYNVGYDESSIVEDSEDDFDDDMEME